jgi:hypothetical protein
VTFAIRSAAQSRSVQSLVIVQARQDAKDDGDAGVQLDPHESVRDGICNVFKVHRGSLDEHADTDNGVEYPSLCESDEDVLACETYE